MKKNLLLTGIIGILLVLGLVIAGCNLFNPEEEKKEENPLVGIWGRTVNQVSSRIQFTEDYMRTGSQDPTNGAWTYTSLGAYERDGGLITLYVPIPDVSVPLEVPFTYKIDGEQLTLNGSTATPQNYQMYYGIYSLQD
jgi:hypothetical protein